MGLCAPTGFANCRGCSWLERRNPRLLHSGRSPPCTLLRVAQMPWSYQILNLSSLTRRCWATSFCKLCLHHIVKVQYVLVKAMNKFTYFHTSFLGFMKIPHSTFQPIHPGTIALCMYEWAADSAPPWNLVSLAAYRGPDLQGTVIRGHDASLTSHWRLDSPPLNRRSSLHFQTLHNWHRLHTKSNFAFSKLSRCQ